MNTKIMCTLADVRCTPQFIRSLRKAGMDAVRINSAHVTPEVIKSMIAMVRSVDPAIGILMDTKGPELRTTHVNEPVNLVEGQKLEMVADPTGRQATTTEKIVLRVPEIVPYVETGMSILVDDGEMELKVESVEDEKILLSVVRGGELLSHKTVALHGRPLPPLPAVSERDAENIHAACEAGIDMIAHSFVRSREDVEAVRAEMDGCGAQLYAKIECREGLDSLDDILADADGLLVARGDLGTNIPIPHVPAAQMRIVEACHRASKPVIVATQILQSMIANPQPTRAEVSDIALGVMQGVDYLLLCGETAVGHYPVECVDVMRQTILATTQ